MGFKATSLHDLVRCSNHCAAGDSAVSKGQFVGLLAKTHKLTLLHHRVSSSSVVGASA